MATYRQEAQALRRSRGDVQSNWLLGAFIGLLLACPHLAHATEPPKHVRGPCTDCLSSLPAGTDPAPLLVLLHGDGETAGSMFDAWEPVAARRGVAVLAPACPKSEGCAAQSWWKWDGDPVWLEQQADALDALRSIDRERTWIVGWSGGGSYIGWRTREIERSFAAIVIHGGGCRRRARDARAGPRASTSSEVTEIRCTASRSGCTTTTRPASTT
jgi:poly(3-hydroxybutyrate) depolymerase